MADLHATFETMEHRWMRAWVNGDIRTLKSLTSGNFRMLMASKPSVLLDANSWFDAAATNYLCSSYRFGDIYVRRVGPMVIFATQLTVTATMADKDWSGTYWITDLWKKSTVRRNWKMVERVVSRPEENPDVPAAIGGLQLWRPAQRRLKQSSNGR